MGLITPISETLDTGSAAFASVWKRWVHQWTQPELLRLSEAYLGARFFHSSQMGGFERRSLREPGPRVFVAVGYLNLAHARTLGYREERLQPVKDIGLPQKLPGTLEALWAVREPLCDASGLVLGPSGLWEAFTGLRELPLGTERSLTPEQETPASLAVGKYLRLKLATEGIDWMTEMPALRDRCTCIEDLLLGQRVSAEVLLRSLPQLAGLARTTEEKLWEIASTSVTT